jgi:preprotein translocase subunit Sec63
MAAEPDPYTVLQVPRSASKKEIRAAYRALVAKYHPDRHQGNPLEELAAARMVEINRAYDLLSDPKRRVAFDRGGASGTRPDQRAAAERVMGRRFIKWAALLLVFPLVMRTGAVIVRVLVMLVRALGAALWTIRGPRLAAVAGLVGLVVLVLAIRRSRGPRG